ncbi:hypothetical protein [Streptomyces boncukensis]|nr:hypothetical protein [Streptomyces boncukensis]
MNANPPQPWEALFTGPPRTVVPLLASDDKPAGSEDQGYRDEND